MKRIFSIAIVLAVSCKPDFAERDSLVTSERVLAVRADPAEAKPGAPIAYSLLVASSDGTIADAPTAWAFCTTPTSLTENDSVSPDCLKDGVSAIAGALASVQAPTPDDACSLFGPDAPPGQVRPRDPDATGGFFQPIRASVGSLVAFGFERINCDLANAPADVTLDFNHRYTLNENPQPPTITISSNGVPVDFGNIAAGSRVTFRASWNPSDAESYVIYDGAGVSVVSAREAMRVSWFATGGSFDADRTGRGDSDTTTFTDNAWTAPSSQGVVHLWIVLRDSRGGVAFTNHDLTVK